MKTIPLAALAGGLALSLALADLARSQDAKNSEPGAGAATLQSIDEDFAKGVADLGRQRLARLAKLAEGQAGREAEETYAAYFRLAITGGFYDVAEPVAGQVLKKGPLPAPLAAMAEVVRVVAQANRGAYDESLRSLVAAVGDAERAEKDGGTGPVAPLPAGTRLAIVEAYYQRLLHAEQYEIARKALTLIGEHTKEEAIKQYAASRVRRLDLLGKAAPEIAGRDLDNKDFRLSEAKGDVVLVVFWASWCLPCGEEVGRIEEVHDAHRAGGLRVVGINLDDPGQDSSASLPNVRRFLLDHNVRWPNLLNGPGDRDYAKAYGIQEIPANVLIGRDGKVAQLDLSRGDLEMAVTRALAAGK